MKNFFKEIQQQHRENINTLTSYIQNIGGQPRENLGMKGKIAEIIKKAIEGETQGVNMAEKVLRGNLDDKSRHIAGEILENDRKSIEKLKSLM